MNIRDDKVEVQKSLGWVCFQVTQLRVLNKWWFMMLRSTTMYVKSPSKFPRTQAFNSVYNIFEAHKNIVTAETERVS